MKTEQTAKIFQKLKIFDNKINASYINLKWIKTCNLILQYEFVFEKNNTIIYEFWFFSKIIAFLRVYFNFFTNFKFIIFVCILQFNNVMYNKIFTSIIIAFIKFNKNFKQRIFCYNFDFSKVQRQRIFYYDFDLLKIQW